MNFKNFVVVMIATSHSGNIGAAARAMKTMGFERLRLVSPKQFPSEEATARASGATDILDQAEVYSDFASAIADCHKVVGLSARTRRLASAPQYPRVLVPSLIELADEGLVALVFGRERTGLLNEELDRCHHLVHIPANPEYSSLNVASAVQVMLYEIRAASVSPLLHEVKKAVDLPALQEQNDQLLEHLECVLSQVGFLDPGNPRQLMRRLRLMFQRSEITVNEYNIWRGMLTAIETKINEEN